METRDESVKKERIQSVDALRGFDMFWIIGGQPFVLALCTLFVNPLPEWFSRQFEHVQWEGFVAWDLIMPLFLFVTGVSMPFSFGKRLLTGQGYAGIYKKIIRRVILLWILGLIAQGNLLDFDLSRLHLYSNTLQAIAAGYLISAIVLLHVPKAWHYAVTAALLILFWLLLTFVPVPGVGAGVLEPKANLAMFVDETVLGRFRDGTTYTWILSSLGFGGTVMLGVHAGQWLKSDRSQKQKLLLLLGAGAACLAAGWICSIWLPIIKHIWTSSMVLWAAGWSYLLLAAFYGIIDMLGYRKWAFPLVVIGMNAIAIYMGSHVFEFAVLGNDLVGGLAKQAGALGQLISTFAVLALEWGVLYYMYRKNTFIRV